MPEGDFEIPLGKARTVQQGSDITLVGWGQQVKVLELAVSGASIELPSNNCSRRTCRDCELAMGSKPQAQAHMAGKVTARCTPLPLPSALPAQQAGTAVFCAPHDAGRSHAA